MSVDFDNDEDWFTTSRNSKLIVKSKEQIQREKDEALVRQWVDEKFKEHGL